MIYAVVIIFAVVGAVSGWAFITALRANTRLYLQPDRRTAALGLHFSRLVIMTAILWTAVQFGAAALLSCAAGFLAALHTMLRRIAREMA